MFALIFENKVVQIESSTFPVSPEMEWVKCEESVKIGWYYVDGKFKESLKTDFEILQERKLVKIAQCEAYLNATDWQVIRLSDPSSAEPLKDGAAQKRALARSLQDDINSCTTLEELNAININFD